MDRLKRLISVTKRICLPIDNSSHYLFAVICNNTQTNKQTYNRQLLFITNMLSSVQRTLNKECQIKQPAHGCVDMVTTLLKRIKHAYYLSFSRLALCVCLLLPLLIFVNFNNYKMYVIQRLHGIYKRRGFSVV